MKKAIAHLELKLAKEIKNKYINSKRKIRENVSLRLTEMPC